MCCSSRWILFHGSEFPHCSESLEASADRHLAGFKDFLTVWAFPIDWFFLMSDLIFFLRNRMTLMPNQAFYLLINNSGIASMSLTMAQLYKDHKDEDGFLYMTYASQEMFGHCQAYNNRWWVQMGLVHLLHWNVRYLSLCI